MEVAKKTKDHIIYKKRSGRFAVQTKESTWVHGDDKVKILLGAKLIKLTAPKPKEVVKETVETPAAPNA